MQHHLNETSVGKLARSAGPNEFLMRDKLTCFMRLASKAYASE
jgi:hypothetical protein